MREATQQDGEDERQAALFDAEAAGADRAMPEPARTAKIHLEGADRLTDLAETLGVELYETTDSFWYLPDGRPEQLAGREGMTFCPSPDSEPKPDPTLAEPETDLFGRHREPWRDHWRGMPAFEMEDRTPWKSLTVCFLEPEHFEQFEDEYLRPHDGKFYHGKWTWWPPKPWDWPNEVWRGGPSDTRYPVFVPSKGRADVATTPAALDRCGVSYYLVVEPDELDEYRDAYPDAAREDRIVVLPASLEPGLHTTRTWIKRYSIEELGADRHWQIDDNISNFYRLHQNRKLIVETAATFRAIEDFSDRYQRVALSGMRYEFFAPRREQMPAYNLNTRIYSCTLVNNEIPFVWRSRFNDDTDISLQALKADWRTVLFNAFLQKKMAASEGIRMSGGLTDEYAETEERREFAEMLQDRHPDLVTVTRKWGRWHHDVDYTPFQRNRLKPKPDAPDPAELPLVDEYGMKIEPREPEPDPEGGSEPSLADFGLGEPDPEPEPEPEPDGRGLADFGLSGPEPEQEDGVRVVPGSVSPGPSGPELVPEEYRGNTVWESGIDADQPEMFADALQDWRLEYRGMPEYRHEDQSAFAEVGVLFRDDDEEAELLADAPADAPDGARAYGRDPNAVKVNFRNDEDRQEFMGLVGATARDVRNGILTFPSRERFERLVEQNIHDSTQSIWWPEAEIRRMSNKEYRVPAAKRGARHQPRYPIYVPSKGRASVATTPDVLEELGVPHEIVVEPDEVEDYADRFGRDRLIVLPRDLEPGLHTTRTWIKRYCVRETGADRHWQMDDNIQGFYRYNDNLKTPVGDGTVIRLMEDFVDRYRNVALAGPRYFMFVTRKDPIPPLTMNTRVYSCTLVNNSISHVWELRYNDDTDITLRALKDGWATLIFNAFLQYKTPTMEMSGGLTEEYEAMDDRREFAEMLRDAHPDVTKVTEKFGRVHHHVDYGPFKGNRLGRKDDVDPTEMPAIDDHGMNLYIDTEAEE